MTLGIFFGIFAALFQSGGYVFARLELARQEHTPWTLLLAAQAWIALASIPLLIFGWHAGWWNGGGWLLPWLGAAVGTTGGEWMFFQAERFIAPSRLSSLLGLRVAVLAIVLTLLGKERLQILQWIAVALAVLGVVALNHRPDGGSRKAGMQYVAGALGFYVISDGSIRELIRHVHTGNAIGDTLFAAALVNLLIGAVLLPGIFRKLNFRKMQTALPYAGCWFVKQLTLYGCYLLIGPIFGNVIMASRGLWALLLTMLMMHFGVRGLERPKSLGEWLQRGAATLVIAGAIVLYCLT